MADTDETKPAEAPTKKAAKAKPADTVDVELVAGQPTTMDRARAEALAAEGHQAAAAALAD
jgi:hypothetical protein